LEKSIETLDKFWDIWHNEYLFNLRERSSFEHRHKRLELNEDPQIGEMVIIKEDNNFRGHWKLGKIEELNISNDGSVRSTEVKLGDRTIIRKAIKNFFPLEITNPPRVENDHCFETFL